MLEVVGGAVGARRLGRPVLGVRRVPGTITWTTWSSAPKRSANDAAHSTARAAVSERSVPTITRRTGPSASGPIDDIARIMARRPGRGQGVTTRAAAGTTRLPVATWAVGIPARPPE